MNSTADIYQIEEHPLISVLLEGVISFLGALLTDTQARRIVAVVLLVLGLPVPYVAKRTGRCERTVRDLKKKVDACQNVKDAVELLKMKPRPGRPSKTAGQEEEIVAKLNKSRIRILKDAAGIIAKEFQLRLSRSTVGRFLKKHGFKRRKTGSLPAKADVKKQRAFCETELNPLLARARAGKTVVMFMDASHFVFGCDFLGYMWCLVRCLVRTASGRRRYNVLGAIEYYSKKLLTITNAAYITATEVCALLKKIRETYGDKEIHIILDNARYQKCKVVKEMAETLNIHLDYIPPYSPNLNLIERLWKFVKGRLANQYLEDFDKFTAEIDSILARTDTEFKEELDSLIYKVQEFRQLTDVDGQLVIEGWHDRGIYFCSPV